LVVHVTFFLADGGAQSGGKMERAHPAGAPKAARYAWRMAPEFLMRMCRRVVRWRAMQRRGPHEAGMRRAFGSARSVTGIDDLIDRLAMRALGDNSGSCYLDEAALCRRAAWPGSCHQPELP
jgi:hypothetical protein